MTITTPAIEIPEVGGVASWYGSFRMGAERVAEELAGCSWVGIPFGGSMCEAAYIQARTLQINDRHPHVINLAQVMADPKLGPMLYRRLRRVPFHPMSLKMAQEYCQWVEAGEAGAGAAGGLFSPTDKPSAAPAVSPIDWAEAYFICAWMPRHGSAGTKNEFTAGMSVRWEAGGGDSARHYWNAVRDMCLQRRILRRANFTCMDFRKLLKKCRDEDGIGVYVDSPFPGPGDKYKFTFTRQDFIDLAAELARFKHARVVARYYDVPLIRELYPENQWTYRRFEGRAQTNESRPEVLLLNGPSYAERPHP